MSNSFPNCMTCSNVGVVMPFGDAKCLEKSGNCHCEIIGYSGGEISVGGKKIAAGSVVACDQWKVRKGDITVIDRPEYGYSGIDEGMKSSK